MAKKELDVVAALIKNEKKILLCQRKKDDHYGLLWEFPGGSLEDGETLEEAIEREIKEELSLEIKADNLINVFYDEDDSLKIKVFLFSCTIRSGQPKALDCKEFGFFTFSAIEKINLAPVDRKIFDYLK